MARYKTLETKQTFLLPVSMDEQLVPGTFEWALNYLIDKIDLSVFDKNYNNDDTGAPAYPPGAVLKGILYNYSHGIISSRKIEESFKINILTKCLACDIEPNHAYLADFISSNGEAASEVFTRILLQCGELGLISGDMFAVDGCKLPSNASKEWSGTLEELEKKREDLKKLVKKIINQHKLMDKKESRKELNKTCEDYAYGKKRQKKHLERIEKKLAKLNAFLEKAEPKIGSGGEEVQSNVTDNESAKIKGPHGYIQGYNGIAAADARSGIIVAANAVGSGPETEQLGVMLDKMEETMRAVTGKEEPLKEAVVTADTGYFSEKNLEEAAGRGVEVIIPDPQFRKRDESFEGRKGHGGKSRYTIEDFKYNEEKDCYTCPAGKILKHKGHVKLNRNSGNKYQASYTGCRECKDRNRCIAMRNKENKKAFRTLYIPDNYDKENHCQKMREKIDNPAYRRIYGMRMAVIEPCFSDICYCKGMDRFTLRTQKKVTIQWLLYCMVHNIGKCAGVMEALYG